MTTLYAALAWLVLMVDDVSALKWDYEACDKKAIVYPYPDDPHDGFPIGSCPPPADLKLECAGDTKIKAVGAEASTYETGYMHPPQYAIDEHLTSRWSSKYTDDQWLILDLGSPKSFERLYLVWELAHASEYVIATSNDKKTWKTVHRERNSDGFVDVINAKGRGRYLKMQGVKRAKVGEHDLYGYSLFDVTICGKAPAAAKER
jgi:F5/8 type C domain